MNTLQNCITNTNWSNEQTPPVSEEDDFKKAPTDKWFHFCYVQSGDMGQIWIDGVMVSEGLVTLKPSQIQLAGTNGLLYNWLGRPCYTGAFYLQRTLFK